MTVGGGVAMGRWAQTQNVFRQSIIICRLGEGGEGGGGGGRGGGLMCGIEKKCLTFQERKHSHDILYVVEFDLIVSRLQDVQVVQVEDDDEFPDGTAYDTKFVTRRYCCSSSSP